MEENYMATERAASGEPNLFGLSRVVSEEDQRGYKVKSASVRFVVAWKPKDAPKNEPETAVLLADLMLSL